MEAAHVIAGERHNILRHLWERSLAPNFDLAQTGMPPALLSLCGRTAALEPNVR